MVLLPGAASAQVVHTAQQFVGAPGDPAVPGVPGDAPSAPAPGLPTAPNGPADSVTELVNDALGGKGTPGAPKPLGDDDHEFRGDTPDSDHLDDPYPPDHASGAVAEVDLLKSHLLDITRYDASIEEDGSAHSDSTVLGLGGSRIVGSSASSRDNHKDSGELLSLCGPTGGLVCLSLLYHDVIAAEDHDSALAAARGGVLALCLGGDKDDVTPSYECDGLLSLGVAEGLGIAERDKEHGHTKAESANELLNLCVGKRDKLTTPCDGIGLQAVHADSASKSDKPDTVRGSYLLGLDLSGSSTYILDGPTALALPDGCGDSALLCLFFNQGRSVIFKNPQGAGSVQEMLRLDLLNRTLLVVLGQAETLAHETEGFDKGKEHPEDHGDEGDEGGYEGDENGGGDELAFTGADIAPLLAGGFLLTGLGALTVAATRRRVGKHTL
ncbi:MAG: hypothetical protein ACRDRP_14265 [Pseudonocardiaceae bacterium]